MSKKPPSKQRRTSGSFNQSAPSAESEDWAARFRETYGVRNGNVPPAGASTSFGTSSSGPQPPSAASTSSSTFNGIPSQQQPGSIGHRTSTASQPPGNTYTTNGFGTGCGYGSSSSTSSSFGQPPAPAPAPAPAPTTAPTTSTSSTSTPPPTASAAPPWPSNGGVSSSTGAGQVPGAYGCGVGSHATSSTNTASFAFGAGHANTSTCNVGQTSWPAHGGLPPRPPSVFNNTATCTGATTGAPPGAAAGAARFNLNGLQGAQQQQDDEDDDDDDDESESSSEPMICDDTETKTFVFGSQPQPARPAQPATNTRSTSSTTQGVHNTQNAASSARSRPFNPSASLDLGSGFAVGSGGRGGRRKGSGLTKYTSIPSPSPPTAAAASASASASATGAASAAAAAAAAATPAGRHARSAHTPTSNVKKRSTAPGESEYPEDDRKPAAGASAGAPSSAAAAAAAAACPPRRIVRAVRTPATGAERQRKYESKKQHHLINDYLAQQGLPPMSPAHHQSISAPTFHKFKQRSQMLGAPEYYLMNPHVPRPVMTPAETTPAKTTPAKNRELSTTGMSAPTKRMRLTLEGLKLLSASKERERSDNVTLSANAMKVHDDGMKVHAASMEMYRNMRVAAENRMASEREFQEVIIASTSMDEHEDGEAEATFAAAIEAEGATMDEGAADGQGGADGEESEEGVTNAADSNGVHHDDLKDSSQSIKGEEGEEENVPTRSQVQDPPAVADGISDPHQGQEPAPIPAPAPRPAIEFHERFEEGDTAYLYFLSDRPTVEVTIDLVTRDDYGRPLYHLNRVIPGRPGPFRDDEFWTPVEYRRQKAAQEKGGP